MAPPAVRDFRQHLEVETPEHVVLDLELAGIGSRALAAVIDNLILAATLVALLLLLAWLASKGYEPGRVGGIVIGVTFLAIWYGYYLFFEGLRHGQTPGKRITGIRVVRDTGHAVDFGAAALRNLLRPADFMPPPYVLGALLVALHPRAKRLGDLVAGTVVVRDRPMESAAPMAEVVAPEPALAAPELGDDEFRLLGGFVTRMASLPPAARARLAAELARRFGAHSAAEPGVPAESWLVALHAGESARRQARTGVRRAGRGAADQLARRQSARWDEFAALARRAAANGLDGFRAPELLDFAARYREVAADLARLRTYRAEAPLVARVERLVAAGHDALYREERGPWRRLGGFLAFECPAAVVAAGRVVLVAFLLFMVPAVVGYGILRQRPMLAEELVPDVMLERAEEAPAATASGRHYAEAEREVRPAMATAIILNNVRVAVMCFAGGALAGIGALVLLAFNGLQLGMAAGHFANVGALGYLLEFIVGHGVLELFAIWVAGAAGFLLGRALLAPGEVTRSDALVLAGRQALRMVGAAVVCLFVAGTIEGFVSASGVSLPLRVVVSGGSAVLLLLYLWNGWLWRRRRG
jgi:uncharacterized RDD family membrane protein YckC/uncharacterized membrane protein SpoIIM required for sporulation